MENQFLTEKQVAEKYQVSTRTFNKFRKSQRLKERVHYFYLGRQIRYKSIELQQFFENSIAA